MKIKHYIQITFVVCVGIISISGIMNTNGPGAGYTSAPGEANCTSCHSGSVITSGSNWNNVEIVGNFPGGGYVPDSTYIVSVRYRQTGITKFGFQTTPLLKSNNSPAGSIGVINNRVQRYTRNVSGQTRQYAGHTSNGTSNMGGDSTRWSFEWTAPSSNVGPVVFYLNVNATNSNSNSSGDMVYAKTFEIPISPLIPKAIASANDTNVCSNSTITLKGDGTNNPTSYFWTFTGAQTSTSTAQNPTVRFTTPGTQLAILRVQNAAGASQLDTLKINVLRSPTSSFSGPASRSICEGDSIMLLADDVDSCIYTWFPGNVVNDSIWVKQSGQYRVTTTDTTNGCSNVSGPFTLNVFSIPAQPSITTSKNDSIYCNNITDSVFLTGSIGGSYIWNVNGVNTTTGNTFFPINSGGDVSISVRAQTIAICVSEPSNILNLKVKKPGKITNLQHIDNTTSSTTLTWNHALNNLGYQLSLDSGKNFGNTFNDSFITISGLQPNTPYEFLIRNLQEFPCDFHDTIFKVTTLPCSDIRFSIESPAIVCENSPYLLTVNGLSESKYSISFNNEPFGLDTIYSILPTTSGSVLVQIIDSNNLACPPISRTIPYKYVERYQDFVSKKIRETVCDSDSFIYEASPGFDSIVFELKNTKIVSTDPLTKIYGFQDADTLSAVAYKEGCETPLQSIFFTSIHRPSAVFNYVNDKNTYTFTPVDLNADIYFWQLDDDVTSNLKTPQITYFTFNRVVTVSLTTSNLDVCFSESTKNITVVDNLSVDAPKKPKLEVYPNPFQEHLNINNETGSGYHFSLRSSIGQELLSFDSEDRAKMIDLNHLSAGIYHVKLTYSGEIVYMNFIKN